MPTTASTPHAMPPQNQQFSTDVNWCCDDIKQHHQLQEKFWRIQRWAWACFAIIIIAAIAGLTGSGGTFARSEDRFKSGAIDLPIITRVSASDDIKITFAPGRNQRRLHLSTAFLNAWQIDTIQPSPDRTLADEAGSTFFFSTRPGQSADVHLFVRARELGVFQTAISIDAEERISHNVVVLP